MYHKLEITWPKCTMCNVKIHVQYYANSNLNLKSTTFTFLKKSIVCNLYNKKIKTMYNM